MHYAEFAEDEVCTTPNRSIQPSQWFTDTRQSQALREAIKEYEANKWKVIGQKVGKPAKVCPRQFDTIRGTANDCNAGLRTVCQRAFQRSLDLDEFDDVTTNASMHPFCDLF
jgi:hypothetical protein